MEYEDSSIKNYQKSLWLCFTTKIILFVVSFLFLIFAVCQGSMQISFVETFHIILGKLFHLDLSQYKESMVAVVFDIRLPRILTSLLVGASLAIAGVIFQAILQNPLADPYTIGISSGAAFGASLALLINIVVGIYIPPTIFALGFSLITLFIVLTIAYRGGGLVSSNLIIAGIIVSSIFSAGISFIKMKAGENVSEIVFWLMGNIGTMKWAEVGLLTFVLLISFAIAQYYSRDLDLMALGYRNAQSFGVRVKEIRLIYLLIASILTAVSVSLCGIIGFIGLIVPHLIRFALTSSNKQLLPLSAFLGGLLLLTSDTATRVLSGGEIPVGVVTTLFGGPFFIYIFLHRNKKGGEL